jgi:hypothetical protein
MQKDNAWDGLLRDPGGVNALTGRVAVKLCALLGIDRVDTGIAKRLPLATCRRDSHVQDTLDRHRVSANGVFTESMTGTLPRACLICDGMRIVFATHRDGKILELDPCRIIGIEFCFGDFADDARRH